MARRGRARSCSAALATPITEACTVWISVPTACSMALSAHPTRLHCAHRQPTVNYVTPRKPSSNNDPNGVLMQ